LQDHQTLHASTCTTMNSAVSCIIFRSLWPTFHFVPH